MAMRESDVGYDAVKILSENIHPIVLSAERAVCDLPLNPEYERYLEQECCDNAYLFLRLENIFGSLHCPNYDLYLCDDQHPNEQIHLGVVPLATAPPRSAGNYHGSAQTIRMDRAATRVAIDSLLSCRQLTLMLRGQVSAGLRTQAAIELVYLCLQPEDAFHDDQTDYGAPRMSEQHMGVLALSQSNCGSSHKEGGH